MFARIFSKMTLLLIAVMILTAAALPSAASAASPFIDIVSVRSDESVTIRATDFPANVVFTVRMDASGNRAENGIAVATLNSGSGGAFEATIPIPAQLRGVAAITVRLDSTPGWFAYNTFINKSGGTQPQPQQPTQQPTPQPTQQPIPVTGPKPFLSILAVRANEVVEVEARNLPANSTFTVRVGPFKTFFKDYVTTPSVRSDASGVARWTITLPSVVQNAEMITVRIDGAGRYAFNAFKNVSAGTVGGVPVTGGTGSTTGTCQIVTTAPSGSVSPNSDFDLVWTVKNNSTKNWEASSVDYKYVSGSRLHKRGDAYDLPVTVKPGESVRIVVDVKAPGTAGSYATNWAIVQGNTTLCSMSYTMVVK
jgi:hypothetical protein